ncbi:hypothetical protein EMN47_17000 [Prolixibacteraceae bacterium JC049]|nr:hypothetical protein [Prolixibacteraceae bacterium JC049]
MLYLFCIEKVVIGYMKLKYKILLQNAIPGIIWMLVLVGGYTLFRIFFADLNDAIWNNPFIKPWMVYIIYWLSELFFGIFPPEVFMIWAANHTKELLPYIIKVIEFASISYIAGYLAFIAGRLLVNDKLLAKLGLQSINRYLPFIKRYGLFIIIVAALTPLPYSGMSLIVGIARFSTKHYLAYALFRFIRYGITGFIVYQSHLIG